MRYAIVEKSTGRIINVIDYADPPADPPDGFDDTVIAIASDVAGPDWAYRDGRFVPLAVSPVAPARPVTVLPQDMLAQFTTADIVAVQNAINGNSTLLLMWYSLLAQRDPMEVGNARFQQGWGALTQVLGADRMAAIATALCIPNG